MPAKHTNQAHNIGAPGGQPGDLTIKYFADDMVASLSQVVPNDDTNGTMTFANTYELDAAERVSVITAATDGVALRESTNHYAGGGDSPAWTSVKTRANATDPWATTWSRFVAGTDGLGLVESSDGSSKIQITNMHDDIVTQIDNTTTFTGLDTYAESAEYGIARDQGVKVEGNYGWLGKHQRSTDSVGGLTLMGARLYNPMTGRFLSMDSIPGGNDNAYTYPPDPINMVDLTGEWGMPKFVKKAFKKVVHKAKKTYKAVKSVAKKVVKTVHRAAKTVKRYVKVAARSFVRKVQTYYRVAKKKVKAIGRSAASAGKKVARSTKKAVKSASRAAKAGVGYAKFAGAVLDDGFRSLARISVIGDAALLGYLFYKQEWGKLWRTGLSIAVGIAVTGVCTTASGGTLVAACFMGGLAASEGTGALLN